MLNISKKLIYTRSNMKKRCYNEKNPKYKTYGARGIRIEWATFEEFANDMRSSLKKAYEDGIEKISIDRIDNDKNYSRDNCRWISVGENSSLRYKGIPKTESHRMSMSLERKGKKQTELRMLAVEKASQARKKSVVQKRKDNLSIVCIYEGIIDASKSTNIVAQNISDCALSKRKSAGGFIWEFYNEAN